MFYNQQYKKKYDKLSRKVNKIIESGEYPKPEHWENMINQMSSLINKDVEYAFKIGIFNKTDHEKLWLTLEYQNRA